MSAPFSTTVPLSDTLFRGLTTSNIHPDLLKSVTKAKGLTSMTPVQAETLPITLARQDVLAQARTGTGKTLAFLLPGIQRLLDTRPAVKVASSRPSLAPRQPSLLVISPTRELALQIAAEAKELLKGLQYPTTDKPSPFEVISAIGGTNAVSGLNAMKRGCDIVVATPGRLLDYLSDENVRRLMQGVQTFVLDEADRLLDMGFIRDIKKIIEHLPDRSVYNRQGMLFSATIDQKVHDVAGLILSKNYKVVNTVAEGEPKTHERVSQRLITVDAFADLAPALVGAMAKDKELCSAPEKYKAIVFLPTTAHVDLYTGFIEALSWDAKLPQILPIHSRKTQSYRTNTADKFRKSKSAILIATDVIARGLDFPNVTNVYQAGLPDDKASYIHRLGRTGRAGAEGDGTLILTREEANFAKKDLKEIDFKDTPAIFTSEWPQTRTAMEGINVLLREKAYRSFLGAYKTKLKTLGWNSVMLVEKFNEFARQGMYLQEIPSLEAKTVGKMGLKGVPGLRIAGREPRPTDTRPRRPALK